MVKAERINEFEIKVTVDSVSFTCEDFLFYDKTALVDMLHCSEGAFPKEQAEELADILQKSL